MATKKTKKAKPAKAPKAPKAEKVLGYFRQGTAVASIAAQVADEKPHKIETIMANTQKEGFTADQAGFAFKVLFANPYKGNGGSVGKIAAKKLGGTILNYEEGTVQYSSSKRASEVIGPKVAEGTARKAKAAGKE
jgi:hypothetical protein